MCLDASNNKSYPTDLPVKNGLNLWLDAADDTTFSYSSGTTVSQWRDKSGQNNHAIVMAGSPLRSVAINSRKAVSFTSTTAFKCLTGLFSSTATHIVVCRATTSSAIHQRVYHGGANTDFYVFIGAYANNISTFWGSGPNVWFDTNANSPSTTILNTLRIISAVNNGTTATPYYDGTAMSTKATTNSAAYTGYELNTYSNGAPYQPLIGEVCEIIVFNKQLSLTELKQVHTYLGQKWGISNTDRSIVDLSNNNNHGLFGNGTVANMPDYDFYNKGTFKFNGTSDFIQYPSLLNLGNVFTINFWIKPTSNTRQVIVSNGYPYLANKGFFLTCPGNSSTDMFLSLGNDQKIVQSNTGAITAGVVQMVTAVANGAGGLMKLYVNGTEVSYAIQQNADISLQYDSGIFVTGKQNTTTSDYLSSNLYALQIYQKALSAAEVLQNYEAQKSKFANTIVQQGLVLNLDAGNPYSYAGAGTTFYDVSGNGKIGTLTGGVTYSSLYGGDFILDGVNGYIQTDLNQNTDNAQITWEAWFWDNSPGGFAGNTAIISNYGPDATTPFTILHIFDNGIPLFGQRNSSGTHDEIYGLTSICNSVWHHVVGVVDSSNMLIYVDGVLQQTKTKITGTTTSGQNLVIGGNHLGRYQSCRIASARCYNIALSAAQVLQNYNATKGRFGL
jgi:hypothetical protein